VANKQTRGQGRTTDYPRLLGGRLCLHFVNTVEGPISDHPVDFLADYADLARWAFHAGALEDSEAVRLASRARSPQAGAAFARAIETRAAMRRILRSIAHGARPDDRDLARLRDDYAARLADGRLVPTQHGYAWSWDRSDDLARPLALILQSAVDLLTTGDLGRVRECPGAGDCGWLFYDTSKNGRRRWCSMEGCGSRVKMRRQYARRRARS
jgi:predicted RNA-binding Zn ribbon-like protein